jgi:hypothetical protein
MGILIFEKNKIDLDNSGITITPTDAVADDAGESFVNLLRNRNNTTGWGTAGSTDAANTELLIESTDEMELTDIHLVGHNFKAYTMTYWDSNTETYVAFPTAINVANNTDPNTHHNFTEIQTYKVKLVITGTMTADDDKLLAQLILTRRMGQFSSQPFVKKPKQERGRKVRKMLSGRANVTRTVGAFSCTLAFPTNKVAADYDLIEQMYDSFNGFLVWLCGGDTSDFFTEVQGFRKQDIYLMACANELDTEWTSGRFDNGLKMEISLVESRI